MHTHTLRRLFHAVAAPVMAVMLFALPARAAENDIKLSYIPAQQPEWETFVEEAGYMMSYNSMAPAEPEGLLGIQIGISASMVDVTPAIWSQALDLNGGTASPPDQIIVPRLQVRKGLPFGIDVGGSILQLQDSSVSVIGVEVRKAILHGNVVMPAISVAAHASQLQGADDMDMTVYGVGAGISKGLFMLTPYGGIDLLRVNASENAGIGLNDVEVDIQRVHAGVRFAFTPVTNFVAQADSRLPLGDNFTYSVRLNIGL